MKISFFYQSQCLQWLVKSALAAALFIIINMLFTPPVEAASIHFCKIEKMRCVITIQDGIVGDSVHILNERAHVVAYGQIIKRNRTYGVIKLTRVLEKIRKGYPVIVRINQRRTYVEWASAFSSVD